MSPNGAATRSNCCRDDYRATGGSSSLFPRSAGVPPTVFARGWSCGAFLTGQSCRCPDQRKSWRQSPTNQILVGSRRPPDSWRRSSSPTQSLRDTECISEITAWATSCSPNHGASHFQSDQEGRPTVQALVVQGAASPYLPMWPLDMFCLHRAACSDAQVSGKTAAQVCKEAGVRVATNMFVRDRNLVAFNAVDGRRLEVVADDLTNWASTQLWCFLCEEVDPGLLTTRLLQWKRHGAKKERTYPELSRDGG